MNQTAPVSVTSKIVTYGHMIKFSHTVFALPFALAAVVLASREAHFQLTGFFWILTAMVSARSAAMGFNRVADATFDRRNPRTQSREIPSGKLSIATATLFVVAASGIFIFAAAMLGALCFKLAFPILVVLLGYSYTKRLTWLCHLFLGFAISLAPFAAWIAMTKSISPGIILLSMALLTYIAGFDILYACQDIDFDRSQQLYSMPANLGVEKALRISSVIHIVSFMALALAGWMFHLGMIYALSVLIIGLLYVAEHQLVQPDNLEHVPIAFFCINSIISVTLFVGILADEASRRWL